MKIEFLNTIKIEISTEEIKCFFNFIKNLFSKLLNWDKDPKKMSLIRDIIVYFDDFSNKLQSFTNWSPSKEWKILLWIPEDNDWKMSFENLLTLMNDKSNPLLVWIDNYKENWEYRDLFSDCFLKLSAYWSVLKECFDDYWIKKHTKELKRERWLLNDFFSENIIELKKAYVDFMVATYYPSLTDEERKFVIDNLYEKQNFEQYIPVINEFLDKLDKRLCR